MKRAWLGVLLLACGCSLEERGLQATLDGAPAQDAGFDSTLGDGGGTDATINDSGPSTDVVLIPDVNQDAPAPDAGPCQSSSPCPPLSGGAKIVIFKPNTALNCPTGWPKTDHATNPQAQNGACTCRCNPSQPQCKPAEVTVTDGANSGCGGGSTTQVPYSGNCANTTLTNKAYLQVAKVTPSGGTCAADTLANGGQVTYGVARSCTPPQACLGDVCGLNVPSGFAACIDYPGDVACNVPGYQASRTLVGNGAALNCGLGTCACASNPSCGGDVLFYSQPNCATLTTTIPANDTCTAGNYQNGSTAQSVRYVAAPTAGCQSSGTATANASLNAVHTLCCNK